MAFLAERHRKLLDGFSVVAKTQLLTNYKE